MTFTDYQDDILVAHKPVTLAQVHAEFTAETKNAGLYFGEEHDKFTAQFIAALATKPFVILSGLSGSGKTAMASTFGQWLGREHVLLTPVRPDWTSPESILGFENPSSDSYNAQHEWHVPRTLEFILSAARDPYHPYLLVLDEMNLAHVEQYFADVLSGMESHQPMVPNLQHDAQGWRLPPRDAEYIPWPTNLFTVGTINVDETTYAFSPKVLDRASIIEFRVPPESLKLEYPKREYMMRAEKSVIDGFLASALGEENEWIGRENIGAAMQHVHKLLYNHGAEFGHRVFRESLRFGSMLTEVGISDQATILDSIISQRVLPKLEAPGMASAGLVKDLGEFAAFGPNRAAPFNPFEQADLTPMLPQTLRRLRKMNAAL